MPETQPQTRTLFISDLHLDAQRRDITQALLDFLERETGDCRELYILGDLFEAWVGDDDPGELGETVAGALKVVSERGTAVHLMHGNRDFLIGEDYAGRCGATLLPEPTLIDCHGRRVALIHGDSLCTRDTEYMRVREQLRSPEWQRDFLARPVTERYMIAQQAREQSRQANSNKAGDIMDVTPSEVIRLLEELQVNILVHGHTHRPAVHDIHLPEPVNGSLRAQRIVLGDWDEQGWLLECSDAHGFDLRPFPLA